ncbi:MAG: cell envelope biogenesis protein OmpA [Bacteroidetes bacterium MedPE-SWsnd-G2]|nr:MAG: cell envelope biogenesis protein OmpA [Bacteroidetes bacterium MedPE-SWsnd-G2]
MPSKKSIRITYLLFLFVFITSLQSFGQRDTSILKAQLALGVNMPSSSGFVEGFESKGVNFPTVNLGLQYMFKQQLGVKLDYGYNKIKSSDESLDFEVNYSRINAQFVYDATSDLRFLPSHIGLVAHLGPGYSFSKPLNVYGNNDTSFFNSIVGLELHYAVQERMSFYLDTAYIFAFSDNFDPTTSGNGSFNGDMLTITLGISFSLSGCQTCN